ncbi:Ubiquitin-specific peptidase 48 [Sesbania bispinosa]|nr:Ubiquitin-specific peptidase 48 [Sesbania bispinosa]
MAMKQEGMADDKAVGEGEKKETSPTDAGNAKKKRKGFLSRIWNGIFRLQGDDFEKRLQYISKEEAAVIARMTRRSRSWRRMSRHLIIFSVIFEVIAVGYAIMTTRSVDMNWKMRAIRVLPMFLLPALASAAYSAFVSFTRICDRRDQKILERLRAERQAKIDELKEKTNYYTTQQLIQRYDSDPAAKAAAATVLASKLGADSGLKVYLGDESNPSAPMGKSNDVELVQSTGLRNRKQVNSKSTSPGTATPNVADQQLVGSGGTDQTQTSEYNQLVVVDHHQPQSSTTQDGGWIARIAALLVGEDPTQSYALICGNCHMHNGLARKEDFPLQAASFSPISRLYLYYRMSRPTTRSKNKRQRQGDDGASTTEIWRKIHQTGVVTEDDMNQLYMIWKAVCSGCRVNAKDNPNCFCALVPPPNGSRKSGLWQKMSDFEESLGPDPAKDLRASANSPAGLTNLGATCYANSILQCLYMNKSFREGIFSVEPDVLQQQPVLDQLVRLFVQLHVSKMAFIDSSPFVKTLELDNGVQQDSHEFLTLLLSLLERCLSHSKVPKARTIVQDLFRGSVSHVTTCSQCGRDSEASSKMEDFYELELNVNGLKSLDESLDDYLTVEELHGDNQYFCESCKTRVDASRSIKLCTLPDVLNFQLKRCIFLPKTTTKKKITSVFSFPAELDMRHRLPELSQSDLVYDLSAVLIHKGTGVNSGHYIAHIKDENTAQWKELELSRINERRKEVRSVLAEAPFQPLEQPFYWISSDWLRHWADNIFPTSIDNTVIQCSHGKVPVSKVTSMKRLSAKAWDKLFSKFFSFLQFVYAEWCYGINNDEKYGGSPALSHDDHCWDCLIHGAQTVVSADTYRDRRESMKTLARDILDGNCLDGKYYISRPWLQQWWKRKVLDAPSEADAGPTAAISCSHGQLMPEQAPGAKRVLIPESFWLFLYEDAVSAKPDDPLGGPTFPSDSKECSQCSNELSEVACFEDSLRLVKQRQRQNHEKLFQAKSMPLSVHCKYFLVPSSWISKWRNYISPTFKNSDKPETLDGVIDSLMCEKHSQLVERLPQLVFRRGAIIQRESSAGGLTIISENDWKCFCEEWGGIETKGISATIDHINDSENVLTGSSDEMLMCEDQLRTGDKMNNENGTGQILIKTCPEVCESCIGERESCELMQKLNYCNEEISVILVRGKEVPRSILEASKGFTETDRRVSKRSRKTKNGSSISLKVSASTSLYQLKMMIWESFGVVKENQILHKGDRTIDIDDEWTTLADVNIFAGDLIIVRDSEIHENRDIADELCCDKMDLQHTEEGFRGTLLTADVSSQAV